MGISPYDDHSHHELSHYARFRKALGDLKTGDIKVWDMVENPAQEMYPEGLRVWSAPCFLLLFLLFSSSLVSHLEAVDDLFNATYTYLLRVIDMLYDTEDTGTRRNLIWKGMFPSMTQMLKLIAATLIREKLESGKHAAPTFKHYSFAYSTDKGEAADWKSQLQGLFDRAVVINNKSGKLLERLILVQTPLSNLIPIPAEQGTFDGGRGLPPLEPATEPSDGNSTIAMSTAAGLQEVTATASREYTCDCTRHLNLLKTPQCPNSTRLRSNRK